MKSINKIGYKQFSIFWLVAMAFMTAGYLIFHWYLEREELIDEVDSAAFVIITNAGAALVFNDDAAGTEILSALSHSEHILEAGLYRSDGTLLSGYRKEGDRGAALGARVPPIGREFSLREMRVVIPVKIEDRQVGAVALRASQVHLYVELLRFAAGYVVIALVTTVLAYMATHGLRRRIAETEGRLHNVTDLMPVTLFQLVTGKGRNAAFTYVSEGAAKLLGIPAERLLANSRELIDIVRTEDADGLRSLFAGTYSASELRHGFMWTGRLVHPQSGEVWIELHASADVHEQGRIVLNGAMLDISELRKYQRELEDSRAMLRQMIAHREQILEGEHRRIAIEIHDQLGQILTAAMMNLRLLERSLGGTHAETVAQIDSIRAQLNDAYLGMKSIAASLHPAVLQFGFVPAVEWLAERILEPAGIQWQIKTETPKPLLGQRQSIVLFRILQEALTNAARHSRAASVRISLTMTSETADLEIADDGSGFDTEAHDGKMKFGLVGMRERAASAGGRVIIHSSIGAGTTICVTLPLVAEVTPFVGMK